MKDEQIMEVLRDRMKREQEDKVERFRRLNPYCKKGQIVFAGSSLMEQFPIYEFILDFDIPLTIYNRGIGGYTSEDLQAHLQECILDLEPSHLFINIGTNDLSAADYEEHALIERYRQILNVVREKLPEVKLHLLSYYPGNPEAAVIPYMQQVLKIRTNSRIASANRAVEALARELGAEYLDVNAGLYDEKGNLKAEYTVEGMHMYANGYKAVLDELLPHLLKLKE